MPRKRIQVRRKRKPHRRSRMNLYKSPSGSGAPRQMMVKLKYCDQAAATTIFSTRIYTGNGPFDPDVTGAGAQPVGYDQYSAFYNRVRCYASSIKVHCFTESATTTTNSVFAVRPSNNATVLASLPEEVSNDRSRNLALALLGSGPAAGTIRNFSKTSTIVGVPNKAVSSKDSLQSLISANPADLWYWIVSFGSADETSSKVHQIWVELTYYLVFFDKKALAES